MKDPWTLLVIASTLLGAFLSFRRSFIRDLKDQMVDLRNPGGVGVATVSRTYRLLARIFIGNEKRGSNCLIRRPRLIRRKQKLTKATRFASLRGLFWPSRSPLPHGGIASSPQIHNEGAYERTKSNPERRIGTLALGMRRGHATAEYRSG